MDEADRAELEHLQDPDTWDWENSETHPGTPDHAIILKVRFNGPEFTQVAAAARRAGVKTIPFVREAALAAARTGEAPGCEDR